ncbi:ABC transporter [Aureobasidium subglaciale]|nr:ABC transporter [Aureobasidium subglaciale]
MGKSSDVTERREEEQTAAAQSNRTPKISDYLRVFTYATKWDFCVYTFASLASLGAGITLPLMNVVFGQLAGQFTDYYGGSTAMTRDDFDRILNRQALYIMALFLGRWGLNVINKYCFRMIGIRLSSAIRLHYLQALFAQSIHVIDSMPAGAPATAITATTNTLQLGISERCGTLLQYVATIFAAIIIAFVWSWDLALVTSSLILYTIIVVAVIMPFIVKSQTATLKAEAEGTAIASEALGGIRLVMACDGQARVLSRYAIWVREALMRAQKTAPLVGTQLGLVYFGIYGAFGLAFWYGSRKYIADNISNSGVVIVVLMSVMMIITSLGYISTPLMAISKAMVAACELFTVIDAPLPKTGSLRPDIASESIVFENVTFEYPSRPGVRVLDKLNFCLRSGHNTAFVGSSGSGKSTIVGLLERWYSLQDQHTLQQVATEKSTAKVEDESAGSPDKQLDLANKPILSGTITIGGHNIEHLDVKWWRAQVGMVQQEPFLFDDSIFSNVVNGLIGTEWEDVPKVQKLELVREACREAYAHDFVIRLPDGYDTKVGDGGIKLSGGQKQRIAIARSIIRKPKIVIFDEATSAVDAKSEKIIQLALDRIAQNRTTITIAHRLSTIKKADHIVVLQHGRAVEQGTHQSLIANPSGAYSALIRAQSLEVSETSEVKNNDQAVDDNDISKDVEGNKIQVPASNFDADSSAPRIQPHSLFQTFKRLLNKQRAHWLSLVGIVLSAMTVAAATPIQAWLFAKVLGVFLLQGEEAKRRANFWALMWLALAAGSCLANFCEGRIGLRVQASVSSAYKTQYFTDMLYQKVAYFDSDDHSHGTLSSRISSDAKLLEEVFGLNLAAALSGAFNVIGCIIIALIFSWKLGLVALFVTMPILLAGGFWKYRHEVQFDKMNSDVFEESSSFATEAIGAIRTVSALTMEDQITKRYSKLLSAHVQAAHRKALWTSGLYGFVDSAGLGCQALIFWYGGRLLASGSIGFEAFFVCYMAMIQGADAASQVLSVAPNTAQATAAANRIFETERTADTDRTGSDDNQSIPSTDGGVQIELHNVSFKYPTRDVFVFEDLDIRIRKGQYVAFVGPSGCGKTTIISLLERFYDINQGTIICNGVNINDMNVYDYRNNISLVAQEPILFRGTVRDNILFGMSDSSSVSEDRIQQVCRDALIHDFIVSLPQGYDTDVGQKGVQFSGGQKQRVAIARAIIRNPKLLLLDEATSALDSESEKLVQAAFERAREGRTMIAVAHRLSTIQSADTIFVFDEGRVVEIGSHAELVRRRGVYWEMAGHLLPFCATAREGAVEIYLDAGEGDGGEAENEDGTIE